MKHDFFMTSFSQTYLLQDTIIESIIVLTHIIFLNSIHFKGE